VSLVGSAPEAADVMLRAPLSGSAGIELEQHLVAVGAKRTDVNLHLAIACQPPGGKMQRVKVALKKENRRRKADGEPPMPSPVECCRPRLLAELAGIEHVVVMGKDAFESVTRGPHRSIDDVQGNLYEGPTQDGVHRKVVPVVHPGRVSHEPRWRVPFRKGLERALRWFRGALTYTEPTMVFNPSAAWFREHAKPYLLQQPRLIYDTETNDLEPLRVRAYTVQIGTPEWIVVVAFRSKADGRQLHSTDDCRMLTEDLEELLTKGPPIFGHNAGSYDRQVMWCVGSEYLGRPVRVALTGDTVLIHRHVDPDLPHRLGFVGSLYTDVHDWKADGKDPEDDPTLWRYGGLDVSVSGRIIPPLFDAMAERAARTSRCSEEMRPKGAVIAMCPGAADPRSFTSDLSLIQDHQMQGVCVEMHTLGIRVNETRRAWAEAMYRGEEAKWLNRLQTAMVDAGYSHLAGFDEVDEVEGFDWPVEIERHADGTVTHAAWTPRQAERYRNAARRHEQKVEGKKPKSVSYDGAGSPRFNPRSGDQMRTLLFDIWDLPFPSHLPKKMLMTASEDRSVDDAILRAYLADMTLSAEQHRIIHAARRAKKTRSMHGRFLRRLRPFEEYVEELRLFTEKQKKSNRWHKDGAPGIVVWEDGRARFNWNAHGTGVGRLSAGGRPSRMNPQTFPDALRGVFVPSPGHKFVGADLDAIHLKIIANLWRIPSLADGFAADPAFDPHASLAAMIFGTEFTTDPGNKFVNGKDWSGKAKKMRNTAKSLRYAGAYGADVPTIHATMTRTEDDYGNLSNRELTVEQVRLFYAKWMGAEPQWKARWADEVRLFREHNYMLSPILGRRADFTDGEDRNQLYNYRVLSAEADIMGPATVRVRNAVPPTAWSPTSGTVGQFHDAILLEVPEDRADEAAGILTENMNVTVPGWAIPITSTAKVGMDWKAV
jgi:uracil-DNA glycosylase